MSFSYKRPLESNASEPNGRGKWRKTASQQTPTKLTAGAVVFRVLCPVSKSGSVIGKGGGIISRIREETGAKVRLEDNIPGCEERVVVITGPDKDAELINEHAKEGNEDAGLNDVDNSDKATGNSLEEKQDSSIAQGSKSEVATSSAQKALTLIFERIIEGDTDEKGEGADEDASKDANISIRLLILSSQVGSLLGKGGSVIKQMTSDSGAQIRVLARDKVPACASSHDEVVQITGGVDPVRKALQLVSQLLTDNPSRDSFPPTRPSGSSSSQFPPIPRAEIRPNAQYLAPQGPHFRNRPYDTADIPPFQPFHERVGPGPIQGAPVLVTFRLLCSNDRAGSVIGKGGNIVKSIQNEIGCEIKINESAPESDDRIIVISGLVFPTDGISPPQDGVLRVQHRIAIAVPDGDDNVVARLLVSHNQIGCILGKGGSVITEMRKHSGAQIRVLSKDQVPKSAPENDEVVQVTGELRTVQQALLQITDKLKNLFFRSAMNHSGHPPFFDQMPPFGAFMGRREPSPPRMFPNLTPFQNEIVGRTHEERTAFAHAIHGPGIPPYGLERMPPVPWAAQGMREGVGGPMHLPDFPGGGPQRRIGGFAGGNHAGIITSTTVDVVVPRAIVSSIYGEDGGCLKKIIEISKASITITEPRSEATETVIVISGTPEQTHAAQSLIQAFVLSENAAN